MFDWLCERAAGLTVSERFLNSGRHEACATRKRRRRGQ